MHRLREWVFVSVLWSLLCPGVYGGTGDFVPDPAAVQRFGPGYRYPQDGWIVLHIEGEPYERGVQHGHLMAPEIAEHLRCFAKVYSPDGPRDAWKLVRTLSEAMFLSRFEREYLEEMRGIADGATRAGARLYDRPLDLTDIAALNLWPEILTLPWAAEALPTGLEGMKFPDAGATQALPVKPGHCSAFAATGPATADGKIVFGHITMFSLYEATFYNLWLDVKPAKGHRVLMQSFPGGIHSGMDYYLNSAGILVSETTLDQTRLNPAGRPLSGRIRKALQYADSIDGVVEILKAENNGLYTNEWLLADIKTNEIAMFELGTAASKLYRSSRNEWFGGTAGFYWGCNNTKDLAVRLETIAGTNDRPANMVWSPSDRDRAWLALYEKHKGKMDVRFGREAFTTPPICASHSLDAKFTTSDLARDLKSWAIFGPPMEKTWQPTDMEKRKYPGIDPLVTNPWTILHGGALDPAAVPVTPVDLVDENVDGSRRDIDEEERDREVQPAAKLAWRGTLLPRSDADIWLAAAFADYHRIVARELGLLEVSKKECLCANDLEKLATNLYSARVRYLSAAAAWKDCPISQVRSQNDRDEWYRIACGKGVLVLQELRRHLGDERFVEVMDGFGAKHAGQEVTWKGFAEYAGQAAKEDLHDFFEFWANGTGLPRLGLEQVALRRETSSASEKAYRVEGVLTASGGPLPPRMEVTIETNEDEETRIVSVERGSGRFWLHVDSPPTRLIVDKYARAARANGGRFDIAIALHEPEHALIVYGTAGDEAGNREAAQVLADRIRTLHANLAVPIESDQTASEEKLGNRHLLLVGRPAVNRLTERFQKALPIAFGDQSFQVGGDTYAHYRTAIIAAGVNPLNPRYSITAVAGLSALATYKAGSELGYGDGGAEVKVLVPDARPRRMVVPAPELLYEFPASERVSERNRE